MLKVHPLPKRCPPGNTRVVWVGWGGGGAQREDGGSLFMSEQQTDEWPLVFEAQSNPPIRPSIQSTLSPHISSDITAGNTAL